MARQEERDAETLATKRLTLRDEDLMRRGMGEQNLVGNAIKFTPEGGRIHVVVEPIDGQVRFAVADTGPGIAPAKLQVIFERFWQLGGCGPG